MLFRMLLLRQRLRVEGVGILAGWLGEANCWCVCSVVEVSILDLSRVMERPIWSEVMM